jgi:hypothetical protein
MTRFERYEVIYETIAALLGTTWKDSPLGRVLTPSDRVYIILDLMQDRLNKALPIPVSLIYYAEGVGIMPKLEDIKELLIKQEKAVLMPEEEANGQSTVSGKTKL